MNALVVAPQTGAEHYRQSSDAAGLCREIVLKTALKIQGRQYVRAEGWQAIAIAHGCIASAEDVHRVSDEGASGFAATGIIRRASDGVEIARAEGFVGDDEGMWAKRPVYARRAMAQTRAVSRACRSAFAHVVVLIDAGLSTTPAEEVPDGGFGDEPAAEPRKSSAQAKRDGDWQTMVSEIDGCADVAALDAWAAANEGRINRLPRQWVEQVQERYDSRLDELKAIEDGKTMDRAYAEAVG